jgi:hypothetical protein
MTHQEAMVIQDLIGGEIVETSPGEYTLEVEMPEGGMSLSLYDDLWTITDKFGEMVFSSDDMK